jgi:GNAT superfamily N-acetyltransferase
LVPVYLSPFARNESERVNESMLPWVRGTARGEGVAAALLDAAVDWAREQGAKTLEAYPVEVEPGATMNAESAYTGTIAMFERTGFKVVSATGSKAAGRPRVVVRRQLAATAAAGERARRPG